MGVVFRKEIMRVTITKKLSLQSSEIEISWLYTPTK